MQFLLVLVLAFVCVQAKSLEKRETKWTVTVNGKTHTGTGPLPDLSTFGVDDSFGDSGWTDEIGESNWWDEPEQTKPEVTEPEATEEQQPDNTEEQQPDNTEEQQPENTEEQQPEITEEQQPDENPKTGGEDQDSSAAGSGDLAKDFIKEHNDYRAKEGVNLPEVKWDSELAQLCTVRASKCKMEHDNGETTSQFKSIGQNLFWTSVRNVNKKTIAHEVVASWYDEKKWYNYDANTCSAPPDESCGHYTQVVWKTSTSIGCAVSEGCSDGTHVCCNYGPAGNVTPWGSNKPARPY